MLLYEAVIHLYGIFSQNGVLNLFFKYFGSFFKRIELFAGTVLANKVLFARTLNVFKNVKIAVTRIYT